MKENMFRALFAAAIGALAAYAGILLVPLCVLAAVMIIDYATGIAAAWSCKLLSSRVGVKGIVKKVAYLASRFSRTSGDWEYLCLIFLSEPSRDSGTGLTAAQNNGKKRFRRGSAF